MVLINKWIISNRFLRYTPFWWWYRLMSHEGFRFDDYGIWSEFWHSLNEGYTDMNYQWEFEKFWGKGTKPEKIILPKEDFDALVERLNEPPDPKVQEQIRKLLERKAPWDTE
jgi:hypothetical protein